MMDNQGTCSRLLEAIDAHVLANPQKIAISSPQEDYSWARVQTRRHEIAAALRNQNVKSGDRVVLAGSISADYIAAILGIAHIGAVVTPMSLLLNARDAERLVKDAEPALVLADAAGRAILDGVVPTSVLVGFGKGYDFSSSSEPEAVKPTSPMSLIYSSGTTGLPKGIIHSIAARDAYGAVFADEYGIDRDSITLIATAPYSNGTWMMLLPTLFAGGRLVIKPALKTEEIAALVEQHSVTHAFLVPTQLAELFGDPKQLLPVNQLTLISAGSVLPPAVKRAVLNTPNIQFFELFGNTEGVCSILRPHQMEVGFDSVGKAIKAGSIRILDEQAAVVSSGQIGEIIGTNALLSDGYFKRDAENEELNWYDSSGQRYVRSGDLGEIDDQGFLHIRGRIKDMIISGGANIYPPDIEAELRLHEDVADAAVAGIPHAKWGEIPCAFVILKPTSRRSGEEIMAWANERLGKYQRIRELHVCSNFPRNALGKTIKSELLKQREQQCP